MIRNFLFLECVHQCSQTESCTTEATWHVGRRTKWAQGSCFSPDFGGSCSGIPDPCDSCRSACGYRNGRHTTPLKFGAQRTLGWADLDHGGPWQFQRFVGRTIYRVRVRWNIIFLSLYLFMYDIYSCSLFVSMFLPFNYTSFMLV